MAIKTETLQSTISVGVEFCNLYGKMSMLQEESVLESELIYFVGIIINLLLFSNTPPQVRSRGLIKPSMDSRR